MSASPDLRQALLRACADVLLLVEALERAELPCAETLCASRCSVRIEVRPAASSNPAGNGAAGSRPPAGPHLTRLDRAILAATTSEWQTKLEIATACDGHDEDSYFCARVRRLKNLGLLVTDGEGRYRLP